jgi:hypothetical protein
MSMVRSDIAHFQCSEHSLRVGKQVVRTLTHALCLCNVIRMSRHVLQLAITEPGVHIGDQSLFRCCAHHVTKIAEVDLRWRSGINFEPPTDHFDTQFINELEVLHYSSDQRLLHITALRVEPRAIIHDAQCSVQRLNCTRQ